MTQDKSGQGDLLRELTARQGKAITRLGGYMERSLYREDGLLSLRVRAPRDQGDDYLVVVRALDADGRPVVAFHGASTFVDALVGLSNRMANGTLKWKADRFSEDGSK